MRSPAFGWLDLAAGHVQFGELPGLRIGPGGPATPTADGSRAFPDASFPETAGRVFTHVPAGAGVLVEGATGPSMVVMAIGEQPQVRHVATDRAQQGLVVIGVQPVELNDFGGSLRAPVRERLPEAVRLAANQLAAWGFPGTPRARGVPFAALNADPLALDAYESGRPSAAEACREGDLRLLARVARDEG